MPRISIIVPVYNASAFLDRCLKSLAAMTIQDFEVIAVDDGSEDDSWAIIEKMARSDVRFSRSFRAPHGGLGPARNRGLELASGEFVAFVDSDDYVDPDYARTPYALACAEDADLVCFGSWWEYPDRLEEHPPTYRTGMTPQAALLAVTPTVWDKLYRRQFLESRQLRFPAICHEDEVFTPLLMAHAPVVAVLPSLLYHYVRRESSITGLEVNPNSAEVLQAFQIVLDKSRALPEFRHELEFYAVRFLRWSASRWAARGEPWAVACHGSAQRLLGAIDHPEADNPYLIRARHDRKHRFSAPGGELTWRGSA
jgi:glycosyltransferase EpsH